MWIYTTAKPIILCVKTDTANDAWHRNDNTAARNRAGRRIPTSSDSISSCRGHMQTIQLTITDNGGPFQGFSNRSNWTTASTNGSRRSIGQGSVGYAPIVLFVCYLFQSLTDLILSFNLDCNRRLMYD